MTAQTPYEMIGGEKAVQGLVDRFYFFMDTLPEASAVRAAHGSSLTSARTKLFKYLSGWLGGPDLYVAEYGHPRLRQRHFPFKIGRQERDEWMLCMTKALQEMPMADALRQDLLSSLEQLASHMINQAEVAKEQP
ncbi:MAG: globin [Methylobacter sp.]|nr:MAG: globin [Methylobacter sp.]